MASKAVSLFRVLCAALTGAPPTKRPLAVYAHSSPQVPTQNTQTTKAEKSDIPEDPPEDELAPAAVNLDVSKESPLLRTLYQATRETKEKDILARLEEAKAMVASGADLKETDAQGRTALHWTVFGSSYSTKASVTVAYEEIADAMIQRGIDINHEDIYQDTALDYLLYSPSFEMQTLLMENGATSGFLVASFRFFDQMQMQSPATNIPKAVSFSHRADLSPGATLSIRLSTPVYSDRSRTGDPIEGDSDLPLVQRQGTDRVQGR